MSQFQTSVDIDRYLNRSDDVPPEGGSNGRNRRRIIVFNRPNLDNSDQSSDQDKSSLIQDNGEGDSGGKDKTIPDGSPEPSGGDDKGSGSPDKTKDLIVDTNDLNQLESAVREVRDDLGKIANVLDWKYGSRDIYHDLKDWHEYWWAVNQGTRGGKDLTKEVDATISAMIKAIKFIREHWEQYLEKINNLPTIVLPDGSVFAVHKSTEVTRTENYWKVVYDDRPEVKRCNIFTMIRRYYNVHYTYVYLSGPTTSLPSDTIEKFDDYCIKYESIRMEDLLYYWKPGDVYPGDKPLGTKPLGGFDIISETEQKMRQWIGTITDSTITVTPPSGNVPNGDDDSGKQVQVTLPADFFTSTHTIKELINLGLVDPAYFSGNEYTSVSGPEAEYLIEMYPFIKYEK